MSDKTDLRGLAEREADWPMERVQPWPERRAEDVAAERRRLTAEERLARVRAMLEDDCRCHDCEALAMLGHGRVGVRHRLTPEMLALLEGP